MTEREASSGEYAPDYSVTIEQCGRELPEGAVSGNGAALMNALLREVYVRYGDEQGDTYLSYHNDKHSAGVLRNTWRVLRIIDEEVPGRIEPADYEIAGIAACGHDIVQDYTEFGKNEAESVRIVHRWMDRFAYSESDKLRVENAIAATVVDVSDGRVLQANVRSITDKDPVALAVATGDINGIAMDGVPAMARDVVNLVAERNKVRPMELRDWTALSDEFKRQVEFIGNRLDMVRPDLEAYFSPEEAERIQARYDKEFGKSGSEAIRAASRLAKFYIKTDELVAQTVMLPYRTSLELTEAITQSIRNFVSITDRSVPSDDKGSEQK